ncbi:hypothetical protein [Streptomyces sp. JHA19]|uniref:hypothetical protein n=1 Tax=Streptomyces sp. JHA19 TaxID=1577588 RepID=UPI0006E2F30B|nr:hypothetical protein [Streptomyces sp. JHA19]
MASDFFTEVVDGRGAARGQLSLAVDETNTPWIAYANSGGNVVLAERRVNGWAREVLSSDAAARDAYRIGLAISSSPKLHAHVAYQSATTDHLIYGVRDTEWSFEEVPTRGGILTGPVRFPSLRLNPGILRSDLKDTPNLAYQSGLSLWHATKIAPDPSKLPRWKRNVHLVDGADLIEKGWFTAMAFDFQGTLRIAYFDDMSPAGHHARRLRVATRVAGEEFAGQEEEWEVEVVHGGQILGERPSMSNAFSGEGFVSYDERGGHAVRLCIFGDFPESPATEVVSEGVGGDEMYSACEMSSPSPICVVYGSAGRLMFARRTAIATYEIEDVEAGGAWSDLVFDSEGIAHFAHMNGSELRYGTWSP